MNVCFVVPDGTGIRNYLFSNLLKNLHENGAKIWIWHALTSSAIEEIRKIHPDIEIEEKTLPIYKEAVYEKFLRESIAYARLVYNVKKVDNKTILINWRKNPRTFAKKLFFKMATVYGQYLAKKYNRILQADAKYLNYVNTSSQLESYKKYLKEIKADCVLCTHQRAITAIPAMQAANESSIHTISAIYSWDNMPKARLNTRSKEYIVWSEYMKDEMKIYYPEIDQDSVLVTGTPQFEFYFDKSHRVTKKEFFNKYDLDMNKKVICYSGDDSLTSPYDPNYLDELANMIKTSALKDKVQILLRKAPIDFSGRFDPIVGKYPEIIKVADPLWKFDGEDETNWTLVYPSMQDVSLLINTAYHCDLVYNVGSTMAHDFAMFEKPAVYINYDIENTKNWTTKTIYKYQHFRTQDSLDAVVWMNSKSELFEKIKRALFSSNEMALDKTLWLDVISKDREEASLNITNLIMRLK